MSQEDKIVIYSANRNYYKHLVPAVTSLLQNSSVDTVYLLIEDDKFPYYLDHRVIPINVSHQHFFIDSGPNYKCKWSYMTMMKIVPPLLFPEYDKVLSLDADTIVDKDIDELWNISLDRYYLGAVRETHRSTKEKPYFNSGVMMLNCKALREDGTCQRIVDSLNTQKYVFPEQDCINGLCAGKILELPGDYNVTWFNDRPEDEKIIHYAAIDKWDEEELYQKYLSIYERIKEI